MQPEAHGLLHGVQEGTLRNPSGRGANRKTCPGSGRSCQRAEDTGPARPGEHKSSSCAAELQEDKKLDPWTGCKQVTGTCGEEGVPGLSLIIIICRGKGPGDPARKRAQRASLRGEGKVAGMGGGSGASTLWGLPVASRYHTHLVHCYGVEDGLPGPHLELMGTRRLQWCPAAAPSPASEQPAQLPVYLVSP